MTQDTSERRDLSAERPTLLAELRAALEAHLAAQAPPLWQQFASSPVNLDRDLSQEPQPSDEYAYW